MLDNVFFQKIGLNDEQILLVNEGLKKESRFRQILLQEGISPGVVESVARATPFEDINFSNEDLLREKIRIEWDSFIVKK